MPTPFVLEELTLSQTASMHALYALYRQNFPLPDEQETFTNFLRCLELNDDAHVQEKHGPYHEYYLTIREYDETTGLYDTIVGGLIFGVCSSPMHVANGYLCSVQVIYLFRTASEALRRFLYAGKAALEAEIEKRAREACRRERFRAIIGAEATGRVAMFFEVNNPGLMSREEIQIDRDLSQLHPALRHVMWTSHHTRPLALRYVQPPLSPDQQPARYLDLFAVTAPREHDDGGARLSIGPNGERGVPGPGLAEHLRRFFRVSVLKGDDEVIKRPCLPSPFPARTAREGALLTADECCDTIAEVTFVPLVAEQDPGMKRIKAQATELSVFKTRMLVHQSDDPVPARWFRTLLPRAKYWMELIAPFLASGLLAAAVVGEVATKLLGLHLRIPWIHEMESLFESLEYALEGGLAAIILWFGWRAFKKRQEQRRSDRSPTALWTTLQTIQQAVPTYRDSLPITILRDVLSDRAARHLRARILLEGLDETALTAETSVVSRFIASRTLTPYLAELRLASFNSAVEREVRRIESALHPYPTGAMQSMYRMTPWHAYYTCVFPVLPRALEGEGAYVRLSDFDRWVDAGVAAMLSLDTTKRERAFLEYNKAGGEVCLFISHILDLPWDELDPGSPPEFLIPTEAEARANQPTMLDRLIGLYWTVDAELACGRMLAVIAHLAAVMRLMARHRQITTDMYCRCTVIVHVTAEPSIVFLRSLGFDQIPKPVGEGEADDGLGGALLISRIEPGAFADLLTSGAGATAAFFGLINEVARNIRDA